MEKSWDSFQKTPLKERRLVLLLPFFHPAAWKADLTTGAPAVTLEQESHILGMREPPHDPELSTSGFISQETEINFCRL